MQNKITIENITNLYKYVKLKQKNSCSLYGLLCFHSLHHKISTWRQTSKWIFIYFTCYITVQLGYCNVVAKNCVFPHCKMVK